MAALKYKVELNESERTHLKQIASRGETSARKVKRALVLLKADEGMTDRDIASGLLISASTVGRVRTRFVKEGLDSALNEHPRPGQKRKLDGDRKPSDSHRVQRRTRRTRGLTPTACRQGGGDGVCREHLPGDGAPGAQKNELKPWKKKEWCIPEVNRRVRGSDGGRAGPVPSRLRHGPSRGLFRRDVQATGGR